jgi:hypothetical protein
MFVFAALLFVLVILLAIVLAMDRGGAVTTVMAACLPQTVVPFPFAFPFTTGPFWAAAMLHALANIIVVEIRNFLEKIFVADIFFAGIFFTNIFGRDIVRRSSWDRIARGRWIRFGGPRFTACYMTFGLRAIGLRGEFRYTARWGSKPRCLRALFFG